jgi:RNA-dependent RNA polymerase
VEPFKSQSLTKEPANLKADNFEGQVESVKKFAERAMALSPQDAQMAFQEVLLLGLNNSKVGLYSTFHDYAVYEYGYANPEAVRLAYMYVVQIK